MLDNTQKEPFKFRTRSCIEINGDSRGTYSISNQIKFKTSMIRSNDSDAYIHVKETVTVPNTRTTAAPDNRNKNVIFKNCALFINCISDAHDIDVVIPMHNVIEYIYIYIYICIYIYIYIYSKTSGSLWQY